jgi:hypothetical protein
MPFSSKIFILQVTQIHQTKPSMTKRSSQVLHLFRLESVKLA